jgi:parallel beta-helix repeat protein
MNRSTLRRTAAQGMFLLLAAFGCQAAIAWPTTIYAGGCGSPNEPTIQQAVNAVAVGGTVNVCPGTYPEQVLITRNVTVTGVANGNADAAVITSPATGVVVNTADLSPPPSSALPVAAQILVQNAKAVNISNLTVDGSNNQIAACAPDIRGIYYQNSSGTISEVATRNQVLAAGLTGCQAGQGIFVQSSYSGAGYATASANVTIKNSSVSNFQKNGITIDGPKANGTVTFNSITGQGPTTGAAENGVQISDGAAGCVTDNAIVDNVWAPDVFGDTGDAAAGILIYGSEHILVQNNIVGTTQFGIVTVTDPVYGSSAVNPQGLGDHATITSNVVINTLFYDAIDICSNDNSITGNKVFNAAESGIHLDSTCGSTGLGNTVSNNTVNESCAGILYGTGSPSGLAAHNSFANVVSAVSAGDVCTPPAPLAVTAAVPLFSAAISAGGSGSASRGRPRPVQ